MHNPHLLVVRAESPQQACLVVESELAGWDFDGTWFVVEGCVSEDDEPYRHCEGGRYWRNGWTISLLTKKVQEQWLIPGKGHADAKELMRRWLAGETLTMCEWLDVQMAVDHEFHVAKGLKGREIREFRLLDDNFRDCAKINWSKSLPVGSYGIIPFSMKGCRLYVEFCHLFVANFDAFFIDTGVEGGTDC